MNGETAPGPRERGRKRRGRRGRGPRASADAEDRSGRVETGREWRGFHLSPFQVRAIDAIAAGHNVLVSAPTGAGKTLVAEYAIEDAVRRGKRCVYTAPIKALSNQKFRDFRDDPNIDVGLLTGDVTIRPQAQVLIMTTEILRNSIFDNPEYLSDVEFAIFDEVHFLDDRERGCVWEESLIFAPPQVRVICLSATISNVEEIGAWLTEIREQKIEVIHSELRPVPLTHALYTESEGVFGLSKRKRVAARDKRQGKPPDRGRKGRGGRGRDRRAARFEDERPPHLGRLFDELRAGDSLPVLCFSFSRRDCERLAGSNVRRELLSGEERSRMERMQHEILDSFELEEDFLDGELMGMARRGIAYHHAGMLPVHKEIVERLFTSGLIKLLFTTETFAVGINMPARSVVFQSLRKYDGISFDYLRTRDFLQMAGRAGRQGIDTEGRVFCALSRKDLQEAPLDRIFSGRPEAVRSRFRLSYSTILHLVEALGRERVFEAWDKSLNQFQHASRSKQARERNARDQRRVLEAHLRLLEDLGYLEGDELTPRGRFARHINGYELQVTEHLFRGSLENLSAEALAVVFVGHVHEERRRGEGPYVPSRMHGSLRTHIAATVRELSFKVSERGIPTPLKGVEWGLTPAVLAWMRGMPMDELEDRIEGTVGDLCRTFRMTIQLIRQVRRVIDRDWDLHDRLGEALEGLNRDEVDARRQLELG